MSSLEQSIIKTVSYFDLFDYPLTTWELYLLLYQDENNIYEFDELLHTLTTSDELNQKLFYSAGFVGRKGREENIFIRQQRYITSFSKYRIVKRFARIAQHVPFIELIFSCNNLAFFNAKSSSDLDFLVVTKKGMLPIVRFFLVIISILFFKRPDKRHHKDTICLSFFIDTEHQAFVKFAIKPEDIYLQYWFTTLQLLYCRSMNTYWKLQNDNKAIVSNFPNHLSRFSTLLSHVGKSKSQHFFETAFSLRGIKKLPQRFFKLQLQWLPVSVTSVMNESSSVIVTPSVFKTHIHDKRKQIHERWTQAIAG